MGKPWYKDKVLLALLAAFILNAVLSGIFLGHVPSLW
jgi:hypothetical protein